MIEDIIANHSLKELFDPKPLKDRQKPLNASKDLKGILGLTSPEKLPTARFTLSWDDIRTMVDAEIDVTSKLVDIEDEELAEDAVVSLTTLYSAIKDQLPVNQATTLFGVDDRPPSRAEQDLYIRKLQILDEPTRVVDLLKAGQLSMLEVDALKQFYPIYYESLAEAALEQLIDSKKKDAKISRRMNSQLGMLLGVARVTPEALQQLQAGFTKEEEEPTQGSAPEIAQATQTDVQKTEFK